MRWPGDVAKRLFDLLVAGLLLMLLSPLMLVVMPRLIALRIIRIPSCSSLGIPMW